MIPAWMWERVDKRLEYYIYVLFISVSIAIGVGGMFVPIRTNILYMCGLSVGISVVVHATNTILKWCE